MAEAAPEVLESAITRFVDLGLEAIEVYHSCHCEEDRASFRSLAQRFQLVRTGGSDFHGDNKPDAPLGFSGEGVSLGYEMVGVLRERLQSRR